MLLSVENHNFSFMYIDIQFPYFAEFGQPVNRLYSKVSKKIGLYGLEGSSCKRGVCVAETGSIRLTGLCTIVL